MPFVDRRLFKKRDEAILKQILLTNCISSLSTPEDNASINRSIACFTFSREILRLKAPVGRRMGILAVADFNSGNDIANRVKQEYISKTRVYQ